jgi:para-aminobenzoate synthetase / 4-amino-4-deoxychorismate lyase
MAPRLLAASFWAHPSGLILLAVSFPSVIEARFDDLTGNEPSFRLVEPVGVLEARRPAEVPDVLAAAESAAARGLWAAGMVAYEAAPGLDPALRVHDPDGHGPLADLPLAWFALFEGRQETTLPEPPAEAEPADAGAWAPSVDRGVYDAAIARIHEAIAAGDTYQVNFTLRLLATIGGDPRGLYRDLCYAQRGAYAAYLDLGRHRVLSASPELFFRIDGERITTRPMKGTAPRGRWQEEDERVREALRGSIKDRAENAMIVDLLRNDLGRIAREGSVTWSDVFDAERFETVWQLTSTVGADLRPGTALGDVFRALFPCGSVTGAPKVRTMELIAELEDAPRGTYCGTVGYLAPPATAGPRARFNVAIRTVVCDADTGAAVYGVGGGITWDSSADAEYDEVLAKARVLTARRPGFRLLESLSVDPEHGYRRLDEHLARLRASAGYFGFGFDEAAVQRALEDAAGRYADRPAKVRLLLDRRGRVEVGAAPAGPSPEPVRLAIDRDDPVDPGDVDLFHKTTLRERYDDAAARHPDADDVILTNDRGEITETTRANVAVRIDGTWWTPPVGAGLLPGCERAALLRDGTLAERPITVEELQDAEAIAVLSSVRPWREAVLVDPALRS